MSSEGKVSKLPRNKVRKACDSCRKRKIKCTGVQPCSSCQAYSCECIFSSRGSTENGKGVSLSNTRTSSNGSSSSANRSRRSILNPVANSTKSNELGHISTYGSNRSYTSTNSESTIQPTPVNNDILYQNSNNIGQIPGSDNNMALNSVTPKNNMASPDSVISMDSNTTMTVLSSESNEDTEDVEVFKKPTGVYKSNSNIERQLTNLQRAVNRLVSLEHLMGKNSIQDKNQNVSEALKSIQKQLKLINDEWQPKIDTDEYKAINERGTKSMETYLLKNKYSDTVALTKYAVYGDKELERTINNSNSKNHQNMNQNAQFKIGQYPLIDEMFGLYSPYEVFTLRGIGTCFAKMIQKKEDCPEGSKIMKETLYLTLRFFDLCVSHFEISSLSIANPLESYLQRKNIPIPQTPLSNPTSPIPTGSDNNNNCNNTNGSIHSPNPSASSTTLSSTNTKALVAVLIKMLPQPFVEKHTEVSNKKLLDSMYDDMLMFKMLLKMYDTHIESFNSFMREATTLTNNQRDDSLNKRISASDTNKLLNFSDEGELLLALLYSYYNSTLYIYFNPENTMEYLELLLTLMEQQIWIEDKQGYHRVLGAGIQRALFMGLSRWEYYVGLDEFSAEKKRDIWWRLYCHEKGATLKSGVTSLINDDIMTCLLPKCFRSVGFLDNKDFLERVTQVKRNATFDQMDIDSLIFYGRIAITQIFSEFHIKILLNERYTSIRNASLPPILKNERFKEILEQFDQTQAKIVAVSEQIGRLFEISKDPHKFKARLFKEEIVKAKKFCVYFGFVDCTLVATLDNLDARFSGRTNEPALSISPRLVVLVEHWNTMSQILLNFEDSYSLINGYFLYSTTVTIVMNHLSDLVNYFTMEHMVNFYKIFSKLSDFPILTENEKYHQVIDSPLFKAFSRTISITALYGKLLPLNYCQKMSMNPEEFFAKLNSTAPDIMPYVYACRDPKAWPYRYLMAPVAKSGFHIKIKKMLNYIGVGDGSGEENQGYRNNSIANGNFGLSSQNIVMMNRESPVSTGGPYPKRFSQGLNKYNLIPDLSSGTPSQSGNQANNTNNSNTLPMAGNTGVPVGGQGQDFQPYDFNIETPAYRIGTLDEFVQSNDLSDLYDALWGDMYTNPI